MCAAADGETFAAAESAKDIVGSRPLFVLTAGLPPPGVPKHFEQVWREMQDEEASWSSDSLHEVVADSHHYIQQEQPERVVAAVRWTVDRVRERGNASEETGARLKPAGLKPIFLRLYCRK